jgi:MerR family copper efflux transcriptional regulator
MNIGEAAAASGVSAKMIRHYESIGLINAALRTGSGYRVYSESETHTLRFIRRARDLGFSIDEMRELLALWRDRDRASGDVKRIALEQVEALEAKMLELQAMASTLRHLAENCHGDDRPDCPIIRDLAAGGAGAERPAMLRKRARGFENRALKP